jgi:hypothetical protein
VTDQSKETDQNQNISKKIVRNKSCKIYPHPPLYENEIIKRTFDNRPDNIPVLEIILTIFFQNVTKVVKENLRKYVLVFLKLISKLF